MNRSLIAEGYAKRHQKRDFQKYLDDAMAEGNETIVGLEQIADLYNIEPKLCRKLVEIYETARQTYRLSESWTQFIDKKPQRACPKTKRAS